MKSNKTIWVAIVAVAIVAFVGVISPQGQQALSLGVSCLTDNVTCFTAVDVENGYSVDGTTVINGSGALILGTNGADIEQIACSADTTWNPGAVGSTTVATIDVTVTGFALGDILSGSIATTTQGLGVLVNASTTDVARVTLFQPDFDAVALDLATTTVQVCALRAS